MSHPIDYDAVAAAYARSRRIHPRVLEALCRDVDAGSTVLEVGCGTGNYITAIQATTDCTGWGVEPSAGMLAQARARSEAITWRQSSAESLVGLVSERSFDLVFSVDVIHHIVDKPAYIRQAYRALKPGGRLCTATDSAWMIRNRVPLSSYFPETVEHELARYPCIDDLRGWMVEAGFENVREETVEWCYDLVDAQAYRDKAFSALRLIDEAAFARGLARLEADLAQGPVPCVSRYTLLWGESTIPEV